MMRSRLSVLMLIALCCPAALAEADFIPAGALHEAGLVKFWQLQLPLEQDQVVCDAYLVDDQLYFGTQDGYAYAVDARTGVLRWVQPVTRSGYRLRRPCHFGEQVIFVTPVDIQAYDKRTGDGLTRRQLRFPSGTGPVCDGRRVFIGGLDGRLYTFDADTQLLEWKLLTDGPIASSPAIHNEQVLAANDGGTVYACTRADKVFRWQAIVYGPIRADLVVDELGVYVASRDQSLYLFDHGFGQARWRVRFAAPLHEPPLVVPNFAYQYSPAEGIVAIEAGLAHQTQDRVRWKLPAGRQALAVHQDLVYILAKDARLLVVRQKDGEVARAVPVGGFTLGMPVRDAPTIYLAAPDGRLFCARPLNTPFLRQEDITAALRPPGGEQQEPTATTQPAARPSDQVPDLLRSKRGGTPIGGKSKVSREFKGGEEGE